jgi:DNA-directed RNA polymerase subunit beta
MPVVINQGKFKEVGDDDVDYELVSPSQQFSTHVNMIPVQSAVQAPRLFYGARFFNQAMPLKNGEAPLVQNVDTLDKDGKSFDQLLGRDLGAVFADEDGTVVDVKDAQIKFRTADGTIRKYDLYKNFPFNRKSAQHNTALVQKGQKVTKGSILAKSNFTNDQGEMAMGMNARVAVVPYKGFSMDDAIVLSEDFAKRLQSEHVDVHEVEHARDLKMGLKHFRSLFPQSYKKAQLEKLDDTGVVTPGTLLEPGDPIALATRPRVISSMGASSGKLTKSISQARSDASLKWEKDYPAEVVDVHHNRGGVKIVTKAYAPTKDGDKIVMRAGQKGIVSKILPPGSDAQGGRWKTV